MFLLCYGWLWNSNMHVQVPSRPIDFKASFLFLFNNTDPSLSPRGCVRIKTAAPLLPLLALLLIFLLLLETA
jgi:hypothetical protein